MERRREEIEDLYGHLAMGGPLHADVSPQGIRRAALLLTRGHV